MGGMTQHVRMRARGGIKSAVRHACVHVRATRMRVRRASERHVCVHAYMWAGRHVTCASERTRGRTGDRQVGVHVRATGGHVGT